MGKTGWIIFSTIVVLVLGGLVAYARITNPPLDVSSVDASKIIAASDKNGNIGDHTTGSTDNKVLLIEYGDYQCPGCAAAHGGLNTLIQEYGDKFTFVFRNFPLTSIHPNARAAAGAAEAAGLQGKFWEMHGLLYENQGDWSNLDTTKRSEIFGQYATSLSLDKAQFETDMAAKNVNQKITFDLAIGKKVDVASTPSFFLNGERLADDAASGISNGDLTRVKEEIDKLQ